MYIHTNSNLLFYDINQHTHAHVQRAEKAERELLKQRGVMAYIAQISKDPAVLASQEYKGMVGDDKENVSQNIEL